MRLAQLFAAAKSDRRRVAGRTAALSCVLTLALTSGVSLAHPAREHRSRAAAHGSPRIATIADAHCVPYARCGTYPHHVSVHGDELAISGKGIGAKMGVWFASRVHGRRIGPIYRYAPRAHLKKSGLGLVVQIPKRAVSGRIAVMLGGDRHSNAYGPIYLVHHKMHPPPPPPPPPAPTPTPTAAPTPIAAPTPTGTAFDGVGMWIWYVSKSNGGSLASIIEQAKADGVGTLFIKSSDGSSNYWSQFSPEMVAAVHAAGLKVCAWQYVYGTNPIGEAELGAKAVATGADCLVIDAESSYEGRYGAAQQYIDTLRAKIGPTFPVGLASFPYVDYHESLPYSVFLGPEGAQFNVPQVYWKDIKTTVAAAVAHTYEQNLIYGRTIEPLGQTFEDPTPGEIVSFRTLATLHGASGVSFWDWQETSAQGWLGLTEPLDPQLQLTPEEATSPLLKKGAKGDQVLWMQEHLAAAIPTQQITGLFNEETATSLKQFQASRGLPATGETDATTWGDLLALPPVAVDWTGGGPKG